VFEMALVDLHGHLVPRLRSGVVAEGDDVPRIHADEIGQAGSSEHHWVEVAQPQARAGIDVAPRQGDAPHEETGDPRQHPPGTARHVRHGSSVVRRLVVRAAAP
jgi:hypothetical protein